MAVTSRVIEGGRTSITQPYHINGQKGYNYDHWGIDLTGFNGSYNVLAWEIAHTEGTVIETRNNCKGYENNSYGNYVLLKHPNGYYTLYAHIAYGTVQVVPGQYVKKGQRLGYMGNTGHSFGGHLHFEIRQPNGYKIDPEPYLNANLPNIGNNNTSNSGGDEILTKLKVLKRGSKNGEVTNLQALLNTWLKTAPKLDLDGSFGPKTEANVKEYQRLQGLQVDGICGPKTWADILLD